MKRTRWTKRMMIALMLPLACASLSAQATKSVSERSNGAVERWNNDVKLDDGQKLAVEALASNFASQCDSINALDSLSLDARMALKKEAHANYVNSVHFMLTPTQKQAIVNKQVAKKKAQDSKKKNNIKK
jgi:hypothetical protein